jgi:hypothetical protein
VARKKAERIWNKHNNELCCEFGLGMRRAIIKAVGIVVLDWHTLGDVVKERRLCSMGGTKDGQ